MDENQSSPKGLTGYLLDPDLFQFIVRGSRLQLPNIPFHAAHWRQPACLSFQLHLASVMRIGQLQSLAAWRSLINPSPSRLPFCWGLTNLGLPMPHDLPTNDFVQSAKALLWLLLEQGASTSAEREQGGPANAAPPFGETPEAHALSALIDSTLKSHDNVRAALLEHSLQSTQDFHLLVMVIGTLLSITTQKSELLVRGVFGAGKTMCIALLASCALRGHYVYYVSRENTTIKAMADFVHQLLPRGLNDRKPIALRLSAGSQVRSGPSTPLDARDRDDNEVVFNAKLILATTGLHLAQFRHQHRPLAKAVDYAEVFVYDEAQQEASVSDVTILGALPRKCLVLRLGDPKQTSGGTAPSPLARQVREVSDQLPLGIRAPRTPWLPQHIPRLIAQLLVDPILPASPTATDPPEGHPEEAPPLSASRLVEAGLAAPPEHENNSSPGISIDDSQSPTTPIFSTASAMPPDSDQSPRSDAREDDHNASVSFTKEQLFILPVLCAFCSGSPVSHCPGY